MRQKVIQRYLRKQLEWKGSRAERRAMREMKEEEEEEQEEQGDEYQAVEGEEKAITDEEVRLHEYEHAKKSFMDKYGDFERRGSASTYRHDDRAYTRQPSEYSHSLRHYSRQPTEYPSSVRESSWYRGMSTSVDNRHDSYAGSGYNEVPHGYRGRSRELESYYAGPVRGYHDHGHWYRASSRGYGYDGYTPY
ncbi:hypothetical protein SAICODRAFT_154087 [Saitoella complicata NRRL Y-17804]|uniref:Uncharacterized protein n=1 Tax=Saitoella complicata (strain BCRC 22490 / CBS 7301 / JCM 7358 / NBRC 10748 / NRRL Y-17804) TaxID=698492 RepID=A0A0E9NRW6_SAICN|nr:uncharacterized protein SAICODRAFT_154087 [Saitoella complicata NRRL Y-17804]ODQ55926.1 hypothetical protein SAICODRAFT_154087 [Saitoella complicata NRRL Y-17804]GAO52622.1 hypothetical protein G7K_6695-t1 [Saitoella complicata NRRL Y-17804]